MDKAKANVQVMGALRYRGLDGSLASEEIAGLNPDLFYSSTQAEKRMAGLVIVTASRIFDGLMNSSQNTYERTGVGYDQVRTYFAAACKVLQDGAEGAELIEVREAAINAVHGNQDAQVARDRKVIEALRAADNLLADALERGAVKGRKKKDALAGAAPAA